jgi:catechol 2,3-dioxygenase-like lactoylglutathione lyase family enzyme
MTSFQKVMPVLRVADLQKAVEWYTRVLGFGVCWRAANDGGGENCMLEAGETAVLLSTGAHLGEKPAFTGTLYFEMTGVEEFYGRVKDGVEMVWPLESMEYGTREFGCGIGRIYVGVCGTSVTGKSDPPRFRRTSAIVKI